MFIRYEDVRDVSFFLFAAGWIVVAFAKWGPYYGQPHDHPRRGHPYRWADSETDAEGRLAGRGYLGIVGRASTMIDCDNHGALTILIVVNTKS